MTLLERSLAPLLILIWNGHSMDDLLDNLDHDGYPNHRGDLATIESGELRNLPKVPNLDESIQSVFDSGEDLASPSESDQTSSEDVTMTEEFFTPENSHEGRQSARPSSASKLKMD